MQTMKNPKKYIRNFTEISINDLSEVGGKNASLGEMIKTLYEKGIRVPDGFAVTATAYWDFVSTNLLSDRIKALLDQLNRSTFENLEFIGEQIRTLILHTSFPESLNDAIRSGYLALAAKYGSEITLAVRSSATAEDLPDASFAGQQETYLNVKGIENLLQAVHGCYASLFTNRAIKYREDHGFDHTKVALSAGVQLMIRSDLASSGVIFTLDPDSGFRDVILVSSSWGLGENVVQGTVNPDEFYVFKPALNRAKQAIITHKLGSKAKTMIFKENSSGTVNTDTPPEKQEQYSISDDEIFTECD